MQGTCHKLHEKNRYVAFYCTDMITKLEKLPVREIIASLA